MLVPDFTLFDASYWRWPHFSPRELAGHNRFHLLAAARRPGFTGTGLGKTFLHLDRRPVPASWFYPGSKTSWQT